ncbi:unnamed protein product [Arabidopsis halleri]
MLMDHISSFETMAVGVKDIVPYSVAFSCGSRISRGSIKYGKIRLREFG